MTEQLVLPNVYVLARERERPDRILLQQRWKPVSDPVNSGRWELPGGKWRAFESIADCALRELLEETGLDDAVVEVARSDHELLGDRVQVTDAVQLVQMIEGPYPSLLAVVNAVASGQPNVTGDGSRDAQWIRQDRLIEMMLRAPDSFTALSFAALRHRLVPQ
ncbi:NUDIX domain-containing protein [Arthrobacter woluwensis]|uniref:NUDIX domain-containing protein n=1 Tax=Arthrobacter woluwensis TaxID=156980 RepID=UPI003820AA15